MTEKNARKIITLLQELPSGKGNEWTEDTTVVYAALLSRIHDNYAGSLINYILTKCEWRPAPANIYQFVAACVGKEVYPSEGYVISSIRDAILGYDMSDKSNHKRVTPWINRIAVQLGGWNRLRMMDSEKLEEYIIRKYKDIREEFRYSEDVSIAIRSGEKPLGIGQANKNEIEGMK